MARDESTLLTLDTRPDDDGPALTRALMPALTVVGHPDTARLGDRAYLVDLGKVGGQVGLSRNAPDFLPPTLRGARPLAEAHVSRAPVTLHRREDAIRLSTAGTATRVEVDGQRVDGVHDVPLEALDEGALVTLAGRVTLLLSRLPAPRPSAAERLGMLGVSAGIERVRGEIEKVADTDIPVLIRGETGSGKELVARAIHGQSPRRDAPFVAINMASVPHTLAASQLFGHERGAFSGAQRSHRGLFEQAHGGTLFLDEIGDTPPEVQVMLLRTLETAEVVPVGGERAQRVDVRVLAATDRDLDAATAEGAFRSPLYHRLAGFVIAVPPLRRRRADVSLLLHAFLREELAALGEAARLDDPSGPWLAPRLLERLMTYPWPGNVRELRNAARQIAVASRGLPRAELGEHLDRALSRSTSQATAATAPEAPQAADTTTPRARRPADVSEDELVAALRANRWQIAPTAVALGIPRPSLYDLIARSDRIRKASDLTADSIRAARAEVGADLRALAERLEVSERGLLFRMRELGLA
ncbi:MAG: sigma-54-dependent Fis family transcriptional regulator [Deltaproteobacteria bacterium]|nr:MAG: sigma-54-dependent Fis family transcriptional regulator [Deltaproteobacteria bacterium]